MSANINKKYVYIYRDEGADPFFVSCLCKEFSRELKNTGIGIRFIDAQKLKEDKGWCYNAAAFVMPGGRDLPYAEKLNGEGNNIIKDYVANGGSYIGFCAGAYYACENVEFDNGKKNPIIEKRELGFFKGTAKGPIKNMREEKAETFPASAVVIKTNNDEQGSLYYQEGPCFVADKKEDNGRVKILASYAMQDGTSKDAVLDINFGRGKAILCGFHPEVSGKSFAQGFKQYYKNEKMPINFIKTLAKQEKMRLKVLAKIINASKVLQHQPALQMLPLNKAKTY